MSKFDKNLEKAKSAVKNTAQKVQSSDIADKAKTSVKNASQKIKENEAVNKMKEATGNAVQKAKENEKIAGTVDKINQNEYVDKAKNIVNDANEKAKKSKNYKLIKIGAIVLAVVIIAGICTMCFGGGAKKDAKKYYKKYIVNRDYHTKTGYIVEDVNQDYKVSVNCIYSKDDYYAIDTIAEWHSTTLGDQKDEFVAVIYYKDGKVDEIEKYNSGTKEDSINNAKNRVDICSKRN